MIPVISFYTRNTPYHDEALEMAKSAHDVGHEDVILFPVENKKSWELNCQQKADILIQACAIFGKPFLYVDSDARFVKPFDLDILPMYDLGCHYFRGKELLSGTLYINPVARIRHMLELWQKEMKRSPRLWDQKALQSVISYSEVLVYTLPPEYTWIYDLSPKYYGEREPVIVHYQASRKYRRRVR